MTPYIVGGAIVVALVAVVVYLMSRMGRFRA